MKRAKPGSQPTRIMPRRRKTQQNSSVDTDKGENSKPLSLEDDTPQKTEERVVAETSSRLAPLSETNTAASSSAQHSRSSRQKRRRLDMENTSSKSSPANEASTWMSNRNNRESPELGCSICLGTVENRAFTNACYHTFCFKCLVEWSKVRAVCPLCKKSFHSIIHSFRSYDDYKLYEVPTSYCSDSVNNSSYSTSSLVRRLRNNGTLALSSLSDTDRMLALRRHVYTHSEEMQLRGLWSSDGVVITPSHQVSPAMFDCYPVMLERVRPWVLRDVTVIIGNGDVQIIADIVLDLLRHFPITSEDFYERLFPYLGLYTRRFLLELDAFARSPFDMTTYDARVVYSTGANVDPSLQLTAEHVEDISSSDDSDIEIVSPAVVSSSDATHNSRVSTMTDHAAVPDLLNCLQTFRQNLMGRVTVSFSFMNRRSYDSGVESPVPGPSGLGQAIAADESDSVGSYPSRSAFDGEERSASPMVLSDADSDIVVVNVDRSVRSPIHISSGEDVDTAQQIRTRRRIKRRMRRAQARKEHERQPEKSDSLTSTAECAIKNEVPHSGVELPHNEPHGPGCRSADYFVQSSVEELIHAAEQDEGCDYMQERSSSHSSYVKLSNHSSSSVMLSPSKGYLQTEIEPPTDTAKLPKRSKSANSIATLPVMAESSADDVKPLTCKKHVTGHKSSKHKIRELMAEKRSAEVVCDNVEKSAVGDQDGMAAGSGELIDTGSNEQSFANAQNSVTVPSTGENSIACADFGSNSLPVSSLSEKLMVEPKSSADRQLGDVVPVPCTTEMCSLPTISSLSPALEDNRCSSFSTVESICDVVNQRLPTADENPDPCDDTACSNSCDVVYKRPVDADEIPENASNSADDGGNMDICDPEMRIASVLLSDCVHPVNVDLVDNTTEFVHPDDTWSDCKNAVMTECLPLLPDLPSHSDPCVTCEHSDHSSESFCNTNISAPSSSCCSSQTQIHPVKSSKLENRAIDKDVNRQPLQNDLNDVLLAALQENESTLFAGDSSHQELQFNYDSSCLCTYAANTENQSSPSCRDNSSAVNGTIFPDSQLPQCSSTDQHRSVSSPSRAGLVNDEDQASPAKLSPVINDSVMICSSVGVESSDSEVEWLETGTLGRQRCISISSSGSTILCSPSCTDDVESVLSDGDSLEIVDDESLTSYSEDESAESRHSYQSYNEPLSPLNSVLPPSASDVASVIDMNEVETFINSELVTLQRESHLHVNDTVEAANVNECSYDTTLQTNPAAYSGC